MPDTKPIIELRNIQKTYDGQLVLDGVNLSFYPGQTTVVIGPSGCGKTVLLKHIIAIIKPDSGQVLFEGQDITTMDEHRLEGIRRQMGFLFQGGALFDSMTVEHNVIFPLEQADAGTPAWRLNRCRQVLSLVGMDGTQGKFPEELSGGQKKRVALARAIALNPKVILYDEPTTGLDPIRADLINELILKLHSALQNTTVAVTHDMASARKIADRIVMLHQGRIIADAAPAELEHIDNDIVRRFVTGKANPEELAELSTGRLGGGQTASQAETENDS